MGGYKGGGGVGGLVQGRGWWGGLVQEKGRVGWAGTREGVTREGAGVECCLPHGEGAATRHHKVRGGWRG